MSNGARQTIFCASNSTIHNTPRAKERITKHSCNAKMKTTVMMPTGKEQYNSSSESNREFHKSAEHILPLPSMPEDAAIYAKEATQSLSSKRNEDSTDDTHCTDSSSARDICMYSYLTNCQKEGISVQVAKEAEEESYTLLKKWWGKGGISKWIPDEETGTSEEIKANKKTHQRKVAVEQASLMATLQNNAINIASVSHSVQSLQHTAKSDVLAALQASQGDVDSPHFLSALNVLSSIYLGSGNDACKPDEKMDQSHSLLNGSWVSLSKPNFPGCLGTNKKDEFMYTLGRMSFDMFRPTGLKCSIRSIQNEVQNLGSLDELPTSVPRSLSKEVQRFSEEINVKESTASMAKLRRYNIIINFTIEARTEGDKGDLSFHAPSSPIRAVMTNDGYLLPDPDTPNRFTVWFTGGVLAPYGDQRGMSSASASCPLSLHECRAKTRRCPLHGTPRRTKAKSNMEWDDIFAKEENWKRSLSEHAQALAAKMFLGAEVPTKMDEDGTMTYALHRPIGGHGSSYFDVLYLDDDLRITKGSFGSILVQSKRVRGVNTSSRTGKVQGKSATRSVQSQPKQTKRKETTRRKTPREQAAKDGRQARACDNSSSVDNLPERALRICVIGCMGCTQHTMTKFVRTLQKSLSEKSELI